MTTRVAEFSISDPTHGQLVYVNKNGWRPGVVPTRSVTFSLSQVAKRLFLPVGYPESVRPEYLTYQIFDSIQGMSSYLRGVLTTRSVLQGAGVGSVGSSPVTAALVWVLNDGIGMIGSLFFAYQFSDVFEVNIKEWRLFADLLNNVGLTLDLMISLFPRYYIAFTALSAFSKACCWVCAGATKGRISAHFAVKDHLSDVIAKESTQETAVALIGMAVGSICVKYIGTDTVSTWLVFLTLLCVHVWANYNLVRVLVLDTLNPQRCFLLTRELLKKDSTNCYAHDSNSDSDSEPQSTTISPDDIAKNESIFRPLWLSVRGPELGTSLRPLLSAINYLHTTEGNRLASDQILTKKDTGGDGIGNTGNSVLHENICWEDVEKCWSNEKFIIGYDRLGRVRICLDEEADERIQLKAYFIACYIHHVRAKHDPSSSSFSAAYKNESPWRLLFESLTSISITLVGKLLLLSGTFLTIVPVSAADPSVLPVDTLRDMYTRLIHHDAKEALNWYDSQDFHFQHGTNNGKDDVVLTHRVSPSLSLAGGDASAGTPSQTSNESSDGVITHSSTDAQHTALHSAANHIFEAAYFSHRADTQETLTQTLVAAADETTRRLEVEDAEASVKVKDNAAVPLKSKSFFETALDGLTDMFTPITPNFSTVMITPITPNFSTVMITPITPNFNGGGIDITLGGGLAARPTTIVHTDSTIVTANANGATSTDAAGPTARAVTSATATAATAATTSTIATAGAAAGYHGGGGGGGGRGLVALLTDCGWDLGTGRSRLGAGPWRYLSRSKRKIE